jgi:hypothetical protein
MVIQDALLAAVHVQPVCVVTFVANEPPSPFTACDVVESENVHVPPAALWFTVSVLPAIVRAPVFAVVEVFAETL